MPNKCICGTEFIPLMLDCVNCGESYFSSVILHKDLKPEDIEVDEDDCELTITISHEGTNYRRTIKQSISIEAFSDYVRRIIGRISGD